jgi:cell fate regulator YaaT (PSP1 superfamily)
MSCSVCSVSEPGKSKGCKQNGSCSSGGCNRLNTFDWFADIYVPEFDQFHFTEVSFKNGARKEFFRNTHNLALEKGDRVTVEAGIGGYDVGIVSLTGETVRLQMRKKKVSENSEKLLSILRITNEYEIRKAEEARTLEPQTMTRARAIARQLGLEMKIGDVEYTGDGRKVIVYYTAEGRVDFRELIKVFAKEFRVRIEMCQIGARQEAGRIGGIGSCGRELCCSTWLTDFKSVTTSAARYQQLSINQSKLSGQCGRLKCCLNYELDTYLDALHDFPQDIERLETEVGILFLQKTDIFKKLMWFSYKDNNKLYPLSPARVREIAEMNKNGKKPAELGAVLEKPKVIAEPVEVDLVGQVSLKTLEKSNKKKRNDGQRRQPRRK